MDLGASYPWKPWRDVRHYVNHAWDPENNPHHSIVGLTGSGKSFLAMNGILGGMCQYDRVLILDTKGGGDSSVQYGTPVRHLPKNTWYGNLGRRRDGPQEKWYRLIAPDRLDSPAAHDIVGSALEQCYEEGEWVIYIDEINDVVARDTLNLVSPLAQIWRKGRFRHVSLIAGTQTPVEVPRLFYDQASFAWIGRIRDKDRQKRLLEIGGLSTADLPVISTLQRRQWLLAADNGETFARTIVKV